MEGRRWNFYGGRFYFKESEMGFNINDPRIGISLPLPIKFLSEKDNSYPFVSNIFEGI